MDAHRADYAGEAMPSPLDRALFDQLNGRYRRLLAAFGIRLASMAVREADPDLLTLGVVACGLGWRAVVDGRGFAVEMAPLYDAALKLNVRPAEVFDRGAAIAGDPTYRQSMREVAAGANGARDLKARGWRAVIGPDGFRYEFDGVRR